MWWRACHAGLTSIGPPVGMGRAVGSENRGGAGQRLAAGGGVWQRDAWVQWFAPSLVRLRFDQHVSCVFAYLGNLHITLIWPEHQVHRDGQSGCLGSVPGPQSVQIRTARYFKLCSQQCPSVAPRLLCIIFLQFLVQFSLPESAVLSSPGERSFLRVSALEALAWATRGSMLRKYA